MGQGYELAQPVFLIGFMGAGKTSVARRLARQCHLASIDMDSYIERREGRTIPDIFAAEGEAGFRAIETEVLREVAAKDPLFISCGGGVVLSPENREIMRQAGFVIHLRVEAGEAASRISDLSTRPLFNDLGSARDLAQKRLPLYEQTANVSVNTARRRVAVIADEIQELLEQKGILWQPHE